MKMLRDHQGTPIRLTDERLAHILEHPEMADMEDAIEQTLAEPEQVVQSSSDAQVRLHHRLYLDTRVGDKFLCVVAKVTSGDAFIITAYLTDTVKKGTAL